MYQLLADEILVERPSHLAWSRRLTDSHRRWHYASRKQAGRWTQYNMLLPERTFHRCKLEVARTMTGSCYPNGLVGENVWNVDRLRSITMIEFVVNRR